MSGNKLQPIILELIFPADNNKSAFATEQLYTLFHLLSQKRNLWQKIFHRKNIFSLELVSTKDQGIRYLLVADNKFIDQIKRNLFSYLPGIKINQVDDYLPRITPKTKIIELKLDHHFAYPLLNQKQLSENDPISYLTGNMTQLQKGDLVACQFITSPIDISTHLNITMEIKRIQKLISHQQLIETGLKRNIFQKILLLPIFGLLFFPLYLFLKLIGFIVMFLLSMIVGFFDTSGKSVPWLQKTAENPIANQDNLYETEIKDLVKAKICQPLFETSIRLIAYGQDKNERINGLFNSLSQLNSPYQSFKKKHLTHFKKIIISRRKLSLSTIFNPNPILSVSELADLYHFPQQSNNQTEDLQKIYSKDFPSPLSMKNSQNFDVVFGKNNYGGKEIPLGLTQEERSRHLYILGQTGSGKTTIMFHMAKDDINSNRGVAVLDPHGDLATDLLNIIPPHRIKDCIYFNPSDLDYPIGLNLMEIPSNLKDNELEQEKELVCEGVISVFRRLFNKQENGDSHRIEYILRNTIYTAFTLPNPTIFTIYDLLTDKKLREKTVSLLEDDYLKRFWQNEFEKAGGFQTIKMASGVTAKIGRFLFSPTAKRILGQPKSTINFDEILDQKKILICNLAEGKIGEDTSQILGTTIIAKIQQAAMRQIRHDQNSRSPFYLFVDEFQNFATTSFTKLLSGGRKFGLRLTLAEQSTCQQEDRNMVNVILANCGTVICFRTASPIDEELMLTQFKPQVTGNDIANLPRYHFLMKLASITPEEPLSGETLPIVLDRNKEKINQIIETSRKNYATVYQKEIKTTTETKIKDKTKMIKKPFKKPTNETEILV